jgi:hypothetical protein
MDPFPAGPAGTAEMETNSTAKNPGGRRSEPRERPDKGGYRWCFFWQQRGAYPATPPLSIKISWRRPPAGDNSFGVISERHLATVIRIGLQTIHPNPGPGRNKTEEGKRARRERRKARRQEKRKNTDKTAKYNITTWNVQRMSLGTMNKEKARKVAEKARKEKWDAVLLSEVRAEREGVAWLGEGSNLTAIVFSEKAGVLLRGDLLEGWCENGQPKKLNRRTVSVITRGLSLTAVYLPVFIGNNEEEIEIERDILAEHKRWARRNIFIGGGDFNAHVGAGEMVDGVKGKFGLRTSNERGRELIRWCEENGLSYVNSYFNQKKRGTWFNRMLGRWYELDGFVMKREERHRYVRKLNTVGELTLSDHKPVKLVIEIKKWHWNTQKRKRTPKIRWEKLKEPETARLYRQRINELTEELEINGESETTEYREIVEIVLKAAKETCGESEKRIENPWMIGKEEELQRMKSRIAGAVTARNNLAEVARQNNLAEVARNVEAEVAGQNVEAGVAGQNVEAGVARHNVAAEVARHNVAAEVARHNDLVEVARQTLREARREMKRETRRWEREWWEEKIRECQEAEGRGDSGKMYQVLKDLGKREWKGQTDSTTLTKEDFREHFKKVSEQRFENTPEEIERAVDKVTDISGTDKAREWSEMLESTPEREEILTEMRKMRDSAPGEDGVRLIMLLKGGEEVTERIIKLVQFMFNNDADKWEEELKVGIVVPLHKKGDRNLRDNYRGVVLLAMGSRILARIMANRIRIWAEKLDLFDDDQSGFRKGRSTADATQVMIRIQEDATDLRRRMEAQGQEQDEDRLPVARLLDLRKAYPRVNKPALWGILTKYGMGVKALRVLKGLHECTEYKVRSREGMSDPWVPARGLREGDPSSPVLFNIYHQVVMREAAVNRKRKADEAGLEVGIAYKWVPGSNLPSDKVWEKPNSEAKRRRVDKELFADDTSLIGQKKEMEIGVPAVKEVMSWYEERNNDDKEEEVLFGTEDGGKIRMLGTWLGPDDDIKQRKKKAGAAWFKVKGQLKGSKLSKKCQAQITQACVESAMLFDCQVRTWQLRDIKKLQSCVDRMYRYIWSKKNKPPLIQMQEAGVNMQDVRSELGIKSIRLKIEKRCLERLGHLMRMDDDRLVKAVTLGWMEQLEEVPKVPGKKRKTVLFYKKLVKEGGWDYTQIGALTKDRKEWKRMVRARVKHLNTWERQQGNKNQEERIPRNTTRTEEEAFICEWEGCGKICLSKAGLAVHIKRLHNISSQKVLFKCDKCNQSFQQEANLWNHRKACNGIEPDREDQRKCDFCDKYVSKGNLARHKKTCRRREGREIEQERRQARVYVAKNGPCSLCGRILSLTNMARHQKNCQ